MRTAHIAQWLNQRCPEAEEAGRQADGQADRHDGVVPVRRDGGAAEAR